MNYFIGINAGGSKTDFTATDENLAPFFASTAFPCNMKKAGVDKAVELLDEIINKVITEGKIDPINIAGVCAGFAGGGRAADAAVVKEQFESILKNKYALEIPVIITTDALITLEGAFGGKEGVVIIAGTGSIVYAKDDKEIFHRAGGFGRIIGDEGSGYAIGRKGLAAAAKYLDSRGKENFPARALKDNFGIDTSEALIKKVYEENFEPSAFAPYVINGAAENDETCIKIIDEESDELLLHIKAVKNYLGLSFRLCLSGGLVTTDNYFAKLVKEKIIKRFPKIEIIEPEYTPELGAALLIKKKSGK